MPSVSKKQWAFMKGVEEGSIDAPKGLSREKAAEFTQNSPADLPERVSAKGKTPAKSTKKRRRKSGATEMQRRRQMARGPVKPPPSRDYMEY